MTELESRLVALAAALEVPPTPDVATSIVPLLPSRTRVRRRRPFLIAIVAALVVAGAALAVPGSRHAILRVLGLRGVRIERLSRPVPLPADELARLALGRRIALGRARHAAGFTALLPPNASAAYLADDVPGGRISLIAPHAVVIEFRASFSPFIVKLLGPGTRARRVRVGRYPGLFLSGAPHEVLFEEAGGGLGTVQVGVAGDVLLWQHGPLMLRIEGAGTLAGARALARSLR